MFTDRKLILAFSALVWGIVFPFFSYSQSQKATITVKKKEKGAEVVQSRVIELDADQNLTTILMEMGAYDENGEMIPGTEFMININDSDINGVDSFSLSPSNQFPQVPFGNLEGALEEKAFLGVIVKAEERKGLLGVTITEIIASSPAAESGLQTGDFIYKVDDTIIETHDGLVGMIQSKKPNDEVKIFFLRDGKKKSVKTILGKKEIQSYAISPDLNSWNLDYFFNPDSIVIIRPDENQKSCDSMKICQPFSWDDEGFKTIQTPFLGVTPSEKVSLRGVQVGSVIPGSCAEKMGLLEGDVILEVNDIAVANFDDLKNDIQHLKPGTMVKIKVLRDGKEKFLEGELGHKSTSVLDDFRIYHDYKGMDENGNYNYDFELDMDLQDLEQHMKALFEELKEDSKELADRLEFHYKRGENKVSGQLSIEEIETNGTVPFQKNEGEISFEKLILHPSENGERLILEFTLENPTSTEISIVDENGARIYYELRGSMKTGYSNNINFSTLDKGVYYLVISNHQGSFSKKLEKK